MTSRRRFLKNGVALAGASGAGLWTPRTGLASVSGADLKFIFVLNFGGWDQSRVWAPEFDNHFVDMEREATKSLIGNIEFVDHPERPSVREFFTDFHQECVAVNGYLVHAVAHSTCLRITMTGSTSQDRADWGAIIGGSAAADYALPQVVLGGASFPGRFGAYITSTGTGDQLGSLIDGTIHEMSDVPVGGFDSQLEQIMDVALAERLAAAQTTATHGRDSELKRLHQVALERAQILKGLQEELDWTGLSAFNRQRNLAMELLSRGVTRVASLRFKHNGWDTHTHNSVHQTEDYEKLFEALSELKNQLRQTTAPDGGSLADQTVVVVFSEMGRTPRPNVNEGKDHWPYTSMLIIDPRRTEGRTIGGYDDYYYGYPVNLESGEIDENADVITAEGMGATLLAMADIDPEEFTSGSSTLDAILD